MPPIDPSEVGLETLIVRHLTVTAGLAGAKAKGVHETPESVAQIKTGGSGWIAGHAS